MTSTLPPGASRRQLRKAVLRMRLEMHRQELRHEMLQISQPLKQVREYGQRLRQAMHHFCSLAAHWRWPACSAVSAAGDAGCAWH
jgi:hypothetical protein